MSLLQSAASLLPDRTFCRVIDRVYPRFEREMVPIVDACDPDGIAVDVGAWYGPWTRRLATRVRAVVSFEANPKVGAILERAIPANVTLHRSAVSDAPGVVRFHASGSTRGDEGTSRVVVDGGTEDTIEVPATTLDSLDLRDVRLVKIDVEGHELAVLRGATGLLTTWHPVLVIELEGRMGDVPATISHLEDLGYAPSVLHEGKWIGIDALRLAELQSAGTPHASLVSGVLKGRSDYVNNVVFVHPESTWSPLGRTT